MVLVDGLEASMSSTGPFTSRWAVLYVSEKERRFSLCHFGTEAAEQEPQYKRSAVLRSVHVCLRLGRVFETARRLRPDRQRQCCPLSSHPASAALSSTIA